MFPRMNITNPFQPFAFGFPQYGVGFGGINPMVPYPAPPYASYPIPALNGIGVNPYALGQTPYVQPLLVAQIPTANPTFLPLLTQPSAIGQSPYGVWGNPFGQVNSPLLQQGWGQQFGGGIGQLGGPFNLQPFPQQAFGYPATQRNFGWGAPTPFNSPVPGVDPITWAMMAQQPSLPFQTHLPIRPLITPQQSDPFQMLTQQSAIGQNPYGVWGNPFGQVNSPLLQQGWGQQYSPLLQQGWGQQFGGGIGQFGGPLGLRTFPQQAFGYPAPQQGFGWGGPTPFNSPVPGVDPITWAMIAQQPSLPVQTHLPIRPLITPQQPDPLQMAVFNGTAQYGPPTVGIPI